MEAVGAWRTADFSLVGRLPPDQDVGAVAFDHDGRTVGYGTVRGYVRRWDPDTGLRDRLVDPATASRASPGRDALR